MVCSSMMNHCINHNKGYNVRSLRVLLQKLYHEWRRLACFNFRYTVKPQFTAGFGGREKAAVYILLFYYLESYHENQPIIITRINQSLSRESANNLQFTPSLVDLTLF